MFEINNFKDFRENYSTEYQCNAYLCDLKWGNGYECKKCKHTKYVKGRKQLHRRCQNCQYNESPTSGTLFHKIKIDLVTAFEICYMLTHPKKSMSSCELSRQYGITLKTALYLRQRIRNAMKSSAKYLLEGKVEVDEFVVGGQEEGKQGRSDGLKKKAIIAVETRGTSTKGYKYGRVYIEMLEDYSTNSFRPFFEKHISETAKVLTDKWNSYKPLKDCYKELEQEKSDKGQNFKHIHTIIMNLKSWIRGIHHKCSKKHFQAFLDEFCYKFNRRHIIKKMVFNLFERIVKAKPLYLQLIEK
jgi:hypothetical protein